MSLDPVRVARELDEVGIAAQQPLVRGQLVVRLERYLSYCEANMGGEEDGSPDPRFAELAVRITDRLAKLYRLDKIPAAVSEPVDEVTDVTRTRAVVAAGIEELVRRASVAREAKAAEVA